MSLFLYVHVHMSSGAHSLYVHVHMSAGTHSLSVHVHMSAGAYRPQKRASDLQELQEVVCSPVWVLGSELRSSAIVAS